MQYFWVWLTQFLIRHDQYYLWLVTLTRKYLSSKLKEVGVIDTILYTSILNPFNSTPITGLQTATNQIDRGKNLNQIDMALQLHIATQGGFWKMCSLYRQSPKQNADLYGKGNSELITSIVSNDITEEWLYF